jgi:hypothetical protein
MPQRSPGTGVYLEVGSKRVFACALDWPGWSRSGKTEEQALETLAAYLPRYAPVAELAGLALPAGAAERFAVTERVASPSGYADFGVPGRVLAGDQEPLDAAEARRLTALLRAAWTAFDRIVERTPAELRKGPRGGGRDRDKMVDHVLGGEAGYARHIGVRCRQPAAGDAAAIAAARDAVAEALDRPSDGGPLRPKGWPARYAFRRIAWHVLDHAWEMEDRTP